MNRIGGVLDKPVISIGVWLVGLAAFTILSTERLFATPHVAFVYARVSAYVASLMVATLTIAATAAFGISCGVMLWWLDDALSRRRIAACAARSFWCFAAYTWFALALLVAELPSAIAMADLARTEAVQAQIEDILAYRWLVSFRPAAVGAFLVVMVWLLRRSVRTINAVIAVAFGAGLVAALMTLLGLLSGGEAF